MTTAPAPHADLVDTLVGLRAVLADERRAIARLDLDAVAELAERKQAIVATLERVRTAALDGETRRLVARTRLELSANAALLAAASEGVAALLGRAPDKRYDRRARCVTTTQSMRTITL